MIKLETQMGGGGLKLLISNFSEVIKIKINIFINTFMFNDKNSANS